MTPATVPLDFFIVGAPKCGTTAMYRYLGSHPDVFVPDRDELPFFSTDLAGRSSMSESQFAALFEEAESGAVIGGSSVFAMYSKVATRALRDHAPGCAAIAMVRDPVDLMHSLYDQQVFDGLETAPTFEEALAAESRRRRSDEPGVYGLLYRDVARLGQQVKRLHDVFPPQQVHVVVLDDLQQDPERVYRDVLQFCGLPTQFSPDFRVQNPSKRPRSRTAQTLLVRPPRPLKRAVRAVVRRPGRRARMRRVARGAHRRFNRVDRARDPLATETRHELQEEFADEVVMLSEVLGRDLTHWTRHG